MFDVNSVMKIISEYKHNFKEIDKEEIYKWKAVKCFQDNWNENNPDFPSMLELSLGKAFNLLASQNYFPKSMICEMAKKDPHAVKSMFLALFDELQPVIERVENFINNAEKLRLKYGGGAWKSHYQTPNSVSVYLFFRYPDKYYIFKYQKFKNISIKINNSNIPKKGVIQDIQKYFDMCNEILQIVKSDDELLNMSKERLKSDDYDDKDYHILTEDIVLFGSKQKEILPAEPLPHTDIGNPPGNNESKWLYSKEKFLNEVYMPIEEYDSLVSLLEHKRHII